MLILYLIKSTSIISCWKQELDNILSAMGYLIIICPNKTEWNSKCFLKAKHVFCSSVL